MVCWNTYYKVCGCGVGLGRGWSTNKVVRFIDIGRPFLDLGLHPAAFVTA